MGSCGIWVGQASSVSSEAQLTNFNTTFKIKSNGRETCDVPHQSLNSEV